MPSKPALACIAVVFGLSLVIGPAAAQILAPERYSYPPGGYRGVPDEDGVITIDPEDDDRSQPRRGHIMPRPYDPRIEARPLPEVAPGTYAVPAPGPYRSPYGERPRDDRAYIGRPVEPQEPVGARPAIEPLRPPAPIEAYPGPSNAAPRAPGAPTNIAALPPEDQPEEGEPKELPPQFKRQIVDYLSKEAPGTIVIDTGATYLYYVLGNGKAVRYGIGVGREGFTWSGVERISRMAEWPDWHPPAEMIERQPYLPRFMAGGPTNPMGARALYLGKTIYRVHGTNQPSTIGKFVSSGCIRMLNEDVEDLYTRVKVGTKVVVLPGSAPASAANIAR